MAENGTLFVVSAPSGAGKTTLIRKALERIPDLSYSVSHTTRPPRAGEIHGKDYFFTDETDFKSMIDQSQMLEWARVHNYFYGTSKKFVEQTLETGSSLILDIDVQGAEQIMASSLNPVSIFILPPSMEVLRRRLEGRGTDAADVIALRLKNAEAEMAKKDIYDHLLINDDLDEAVSMLCTLFESEMGLRR